MSVKMINVFAVPDDHVDEFLKRWSATTQVYAHTERFTETHLHRKAGVDNLAFKSINIAVRESNEAFVQAHRDYVPGEESIRGISFHPAVFEKIIMTRSLLSSRSLGDE